MIHMFIISMLACGQKETDTGSEDTGSEHTGEPTQEDLYLIGSWEDNYGGLMDISNTEISSIYGSSYAIQEYSNEDMWIVAQNDSDNSYNPDLWSKFEWTEVEGEIYYCQSAYDAADAETAQEAMADTSDLSSGCGGFGWSTIRTQLSITGSYTDNWGGSHDVDAFIWTSGSSVFLIDTVNEEEEWVVAQNASDNEYNPDLWSKFEWMLDGELLYYCQSSFDAVDAQTAQDTTANRSDIEAGCGGFGWSTLSADE